MKMDLDDIKRGLRAEIKKRENEQYATFQCNVRQMCKDVLAKLEEQESDIAELQKQVHDYDAVLRKIDTVEKECIRIANLYEAEKAKSARLERELDNILARLDYPDEYI